MQLKRYILTNDQIIDINVNNVLDDIDMTTIIDTADTIKELLKSGWLVESKSNVIGVVYDRGDFKEIVWCAGFATTRVEKLLIKGVKNIQIPTTDGYKVIWSNPTNKS